MLFALLAAAGAALVPASADGALVLEDASGLRAFFETAGHHAPSLSPAALGRSLRDTVGVDLFAEQPEWSLKKGPRALVTMGKTVGLSAPVADAKAARRALEAWLGPSRPTRPKPLKGPLAAGDRAGMIAPVAGSQRLLIASGRNATALVSALAHPKPFSKDKALLAQATGLVWLYLRGQAPLRAALLRVEASGSGMIARGLVTSERDALLTGPAPAACEGTPPGCLRVAPGPAGRALLALVFDRLQLAPPPAGAVVARLDGIDLRQLSDERSLPRALQISVAAAPADPASAALSAELDLAAIAAALARLSPLDALRGSLAAGTYAGFLLYGPLLKNTGPLTLIGVPAKTAAQIELRLPLR